jgi:hypothetical protein
LAHLSRGVQGGAYVVDLQEDRDVTMSDRSSLFGATDKKAHKGEVPCARCDMFFQPLDMLTSFREEHMYWSTKHNEQMPGRICVYCTHELQQEEHARRGGVAGECPTLEACWEEICARKKIKAGNRTAAHKAAIRQIDANQKNDKKNGIFFFDDGSKKERRREDYKSLIGNHLISACAAGNLFSAFNNVAVTMETVRQMTENVEKWRKKAHRRKPEAAPTTTSTKCSTGTQRSPTTTQKMKKS